MSRSAPGRHSAFTLLELLVVIAIRVCCSPCSWLLEKNSEKMVDRAEKRNKLVVC